ncbi:MAG: M28 family peptidase [Planctomycetota bacterium]|jgi:hypothetical protein
MLAGCGSAAAVGPAPEQAYEAFEAEAFERHVRFLADPSLHGRMTGTPGSAKAAEYVARQFKSCGLEPGGDDGGWYQRFSVGRIRRPAKDCRLSFSYQEAAVGEQPGGAKAGFSRAGRLGRDFAPMAMGASGEFEGPLVFAGYGCRNRIRGHDDYAGVDVKGSVVMVMLGEPHDGEGRSKWAIFGGWTELAAASHKIERAAEQGAAGVLLVAPPDIAGEHDPLDNVLGYGDGELPAMRISRQFADALLKAAGRKTIAELAKEINAAGDAKSFRVGGKVSGKVELAEGSARNVIGILPSDVSKDAPVIAVCAHYDHIDPYGELASDSGFGVRPGADDNASGVSAMILIARGLAETPGRGCSYLFVSSGAEEIGFLGAKHLLDKASPFPRERMKAAVAIEMVGRVRRGPLLVLGNVLSEPMGPAIRSALRQKGRVSILCLPITSKSHWSDQAPFTAAGLPTLLFCGLLHGHYHRMSDTLEHVSFRGGAKAARTIFEVLRGIDAAVSKQAGGAP